MAFPLDPTNAAPSYYTTNAPYSVLFNVFYVGEAVTINITSATPNAYTVYDYYGNVAATGAVSSTAVNLGSSFSPGWYRVRLTGSTTGDLVYGDSYGAASFCVIRNTAYMVPRPATSTHGNGAPGQHSNPPEYRRSFMGGAPPRMEMAASITADTAGNDSVAVLALDAPYAQTYWLDPGYQYADPDRPRFSECSISSRSWDKIDLNNGSAQACLTVFPANGTAASTANNLYVSVTAGTSSGFKLVVSYPNNTTVVETYDNMATTDAVVAAVNGVSSYIWINLVRSADTPANVAATAIGNAYWTGTVYCSNTLYPLGVHNYEGPTNEPGLSDGSLGQKMKLFAAAIKAGNANAKVLGPCPVDIVNSWSNFFIGGGQQYLDYLSFHDYNTFLGWGAIQLSRTQIESFLTLKAQYAPTLPLWQTEATYAAICSGGGASSFGLFSPRVSGGTMLNLLMWEQYGLPRERNAYWYDTSHGFWSVPFFQEIGTASHAAPIHPLTRTLAEETFGKPFSYRLDMGCEALEKLCIGSVYQAHSGTLSPSTVVLLLGSHIPGAAMNLTITGTTSALTVVDAFGNTSTVTPSSGRVQVPLDDVPTYLELPAGVTATVYSFYDGAQDWGPTPNPSVSRAATTHTLGGVSNTVMCDDQWMSLFAPYPGGTGIVYSTVLVPDAAILLFGSTISVDRVVIFNGPPNQAMSGLLTFTVDTTADGGSTWTTQETVDISSQSTSLQFGTSSNDAGCRYETFASMQHSFPVSFASPVSCNGVRVSVTATTYGASPDAQSYHTSASGVNEQRVSLQEIMVISSSAPTNSVTAPAASQLPVITGSGRLGTVATCSKGTWTQFPTKYAFQWKRDGSDIVGSTSAHYAVASADVGHVLTCVVTASNLGGSATQTSGGVSVPVLRMSA